MPLKIGELSAYISCDDKELQIFSAKQEDDKTASGWIASEVSKEFRVHWTEPTGTLTLTVQIHVDGRPAQRLIHKPSCRAGSCQGVYGQQASVRPFQFSKLILMDDDSMNTTAASDKLGSIEVIMTICEGFAACTSPYSPTTLDEIGPIHERSKKAGVHAVTLGALKTMQAFTPQKAVGEAKEPCARFVFRYRPLELLRANDLAPPAPQPVPSPTHRGEAQDSADAAGPSNSTRKRRALSVKSEVVSEDEDEDVDETSLEEQLALIQSRLEKKRAKRAKTIVKRETSPIRVPSALCDEVIDLT